MSSGIVVLNVMWSLIRRVSQEDVLVIGDNDNTCTSDIRVYGSTLYVGLARAVSHTNTNFRLTFLLTRLQEALYEDLAV